MRNKKRVGAVVVASAFAAIIASPVLVASAEQGHAAPMAAAASPSFRATGTHQCQSSTTIGHTCSVMGIGFNDCNEAYLTLSRQDCCPSTSGGGGTIGFTLDYCNII